MQESAADASTGAVNSVLRRNIDALRRNRVEAEQSAGGHEKIAAAATRAVGRMGFVYAHIGVIAVWVANGLGWTPGLKPVDPSFVSLATAASVEAIFLSTFILIAQNRAAVIADRRSDLDLQISLLTEHEVTRVLDLCTEIAGKLNVSAAEDPKLDELRREVAPEHVLDEIQGAEDRQK